MFLKVLENVPACSKLVSDVLATISPTFITWGWLYKKIVTLSAKVN
jgi:hypothetical protein